MSGSDDQNAECPLCMEPLELDDLNFFPCTCGYQICRFCWHRIRTDENGLCPACRKQYPEDPADFKPLTHEELQRIKNEKRQKDLQRKQKMSDNRKHLGNVRVVQKNLVFVVGLSPRLGEAEVLKRNEYFGKFGKIHKVVINHTTSYAGSQVFASRDKGPSASAYVTYCRVEDALRAIQAVNNIHVDGRTLKASLGTTKYCSHFLKGQNCPKPECMYLHEIGDHSASFTKEEMQLGKHQEYEKKLHEQLCNSSRKQSGSPLLGSQEGDRDLMSGESSGVGGSETSSGSCIGGKKSGRNKAQCKKENAGKSRNRIASEDDKRTSKAKSSNENAPPSQRRGRSRGSSRRGGGGGGASANSSAVQKTRKPSPDRNSNGNGNNNNVHTSERCHVKSPPQQMSLDSLSSVSLQPVCQPPATSLSPLPPPITPLSNSSTSGFSTATGGGDGGQSSSSSGAESPAQCLANLDSSLSSAASSLSSSSADALLPFFDARTGFSPSTPNMLSSHTSEHSPLDWMRSSPTPDGISAVQSEVPLIGSTQPANTDWQAAFGFTPAQSKDDDLGFDPWDESSKALADLMEKETNVCLSPSTISSINDGGYNGVSHVDTTQRPFANGPHMSPSHVSHDGTRRLGAPPGFTASHPVPAAYNAGRSMLPDSTGSSKLLSLMCLAQHHQQQQQQQQLTKQQCQPPPLAQPQTQSLVNGLSHSAALQQHVQHNGHAHQPMNLNHSMSLHQQQQQQQLHPQLHPHTHHQSMANHHHPYYGGDPSSSSSSYMGMNGAPPKANHHMKEIQGNNHTKNQDSFNVKEWQDNLRALFPNVNITFGGQNGSVPRQPAAQQKAGYSLASNAPTEGSWVAQDPAVLSAGCVTTVRSDSPPHWMKSLQQLTEVDVPYNNHRAPVVNHYAYRNSQWTNPTQIPPPGFGSSLGRSTHKPTEPQKMIDNF